MSATLNDVKNQTFDYIVVGGGLAGVTIAARLSEDEDKTVCVLEAGGANLNDPMILRTGGYGTHFGNKTYDWGHETTKSRLLNDRAWAWNRGRCLGGSSAINFMLYTKPPAEELDDFELLGNPGWNWKNLQKYMNKGEGFMDASPGVKQQMNIGPVEGVARNGPLVITYPRVCSDLMVRTRDALYNGGVAPAKCPYDGDVSGVCLTLNTVDPRTNTRSYAVTAHYLPNKDRKNLTVLVHARVSRVLTERASDGGGQWTATAVEFQYDGETHVVYAGKEVILSAGALRSPQILELSGFGRQDILEKAGVPLKQELQGVGENMQEHVLLGTSHELKDDYDVLTFDALRDPKRLAEEIELYDQNKPGILSMGLVTAAFLHLDEITPEAQSIFQQAKKEVGKLDIAGALPPGLKEQYDIQLHRLQPGTGKGPQCEFICFPGLLSQPNPPAEGKRYISLCAAANGLFSRGTIHIHSNDPTEEPEIDPHYLEREIDLKVLVEMVKYARNLAGISPLKEVIAAELNPGPNVKTDDQIEDWIKATLMSTWHTAGTCAMLPRDKGGVVDHNLKVYGTNNLRVVDLSVVPLHFDAHTQAVVYGIAELAADIIKGRFLSE